MRNSRVTLLLMTLLCLLPVSGCWDNIELEDRAIVAALGVDRKADGELLVTAQVVIPTQVGSSQQSSMRGGPQGEKPFHVISAQAPTMSEAAGKLAREAGRLLFFPFMEVIIIGEDMARTGIEPVVDWVNRERELRSRTLLCVSHGKANEILKVPGSGLQKIPAYFISSSARTCNKYTSRLFLSDFTYFSGCIASGCTGMVVMGITVEEVSKQKQPKIVDSAVFKKYRQVGWLNRTETRGYLWATNSQRRAIISGTLPAGEQIAFEVRDSNVDINSYFVEGSPVISINVRAKTNISEVHDVTESLEKPGNLDKLEQVIEKQITNEISAAVEKSRELNVDILEFGTVIRRQHPQEWKSIKGDWETLFSEVPVEVQVQTEIRRTQQINNPVKPED